MKRKVNLVGKSTLTISLPSRWAEKYGIKKGHELEVIEDNKSLIFQLEKDNKNPKEIYLKLKYSNPEYITEIIRNLYMNGYEKVSLGFNNPEDILAITEAINLLIGFEVIEQSQMECIIKDIVCENKEDYEIIIRKTWLTIKLMFELLIDVLENKNSELNYNKMKAFEANNTKFSCYCRRILFKYDLIYDEKGLANYTIVNLIRRIGLDIYLLHNHLFYNKFKARRETIEFSKKCLEVFNLLYDSYFKKNTSEEIYILTENYLSESKKLATKYPKDAIIFLSLTGILRIIANTLPKVEVLSHKK